jgi:dUTP pyrophosphatase
MRVNIVQLHPDASIPRYATPGSSCFDFVAIEDVEIAPGSTKLVRTGLAFEIPAGFELQVRPRSGISLNTPLRVSNSPGTVDADFRGEVCLVMTLLVCRGVQFNYFIKKGDRLAQGAICPVVRVEFESTTGISQTQRGSGGFGSTGK